MIKDDKKIIGLGFHHANLKHFKHGKAMVIDLHEMNITEADMIYIFAGRNDADLIKQMQEYIGPDTVVNEL